MSTTGSRANLTLCSSALDYPPFFAYFEWFMSLFARIIDPKITDLNNLNYDAWSVIAFQRSTVIITELVMAVALLKYVTALFWPYFSKLTFSP